MRYQANDLNFGVSVDIPAWNLPPGVMTDSLNVRYRDGGAEKMQGWDDVFGATSVTGSCALDMVADDDLNVFYVYGDTDNLYYARSAGAAHVKISHTSFSASVDVGFNGGSYNGYLVYTGGGKLQPFSWDPNTPATATAFLTGSPVCDVIRPFKNFLIALRVTEGSDKKPLMLRWSSSAFTGLPSSWDYTDPANDSGRVTLADSSDPIIDCLPLRGANIVYKEQHTWAMDYVGGSNVFSFRELFGEVGMLAEQCASAFKNMHFVVTNNDVVVHDGNEAQSVVDRKTRDWLFNRIDADNYRRSFVVRDNRNREMIFCYPEEGASAPNAALVWNWQSNSVYPRDLGGTMARGTNGRLPDTFSRATYATRNTAEEYSFLTRNDRREIVYFSNSEIYKGISDSANMDIYLERKNVPLDKDINSYKRVLRCYPWVQGTDGDSIKVQLYTKDALSDASRTTASASFTIGQDYKTDFRASSRVYDIRFIYEGTNDVKLYGYDLEFFREGER